MSRSFKAFLSTLQDTADVRVALLSSTDYGNGFNMQDGCGNHYAKNWMTALNELGCDFQIAEVGFEQICNTNQIFITLDTGRNILTDRLDYLSNEAAIYNSIVSRFFQPLNIRG